MLPACEDTFVELDKSDAEADDCVAVVVFVAVEDDDDAAAVAAGVALLDAA